MAIGRAARNSAAHRYQTARRFTSTLRTAGSPERTRWYALYYDCPAVLTLRSWGADDAKQMLDLLNSAIRSGTQQAICCQLASCTSSRAFDLLCASCEKRGLVFVGCPDAKEGSVFYDRDPSWQHELVSGPLT